MKLLTVNVRGIETEICYESSGYCSETNDHGITWFFEDVSLDLQLTPEEETSILDQISENED